MEYELAKKLQEAGFPQDLTDPSTYYDEQRQQVAWKENDESKIPNNYVKIPTLEELIEACGPRINCLERLNRPYAWHAWNGQSNDMSKTGEGTTPSAAVARLWLALTA
jgi:hypothetical protein